MARCDSYDAGECTWGACALEGWVPEWLGNANQWLTNAAGKGLVTTGYPMVNAVAVYADARLYDADFGHCAVVIAVQSYSSYQVREMNFAAWNAYDDRWTDRTGLLGFILPPGVSPPSPPPPSPPPPPTTNRDRANQAWSSFAHIYDQEWPDRITDLRITQTRARSLQQA